MLSEWLTCLLTVMLMMLDDCVWCFVNSTSLMSPSRSNLIIVTSCLMFTRVGMVTFGSPKRRVLHSPQDLSSMLARPMIYKHSHHCLSWNIPYRSTQDISHEDYSYLRLPNPKIISILHEYSSIGYPIPSSHSVFPGEDQNDVSISPSQLGRTYLFL